MKIRSPCQKYSGFNRKIIHKKVPDAINNKKEALALQSKRNSPIRTMAQQMISCGSILDRSLNEERRKSIHRVLVSWPLAL